MRLWSFHPKYLDRKGLVACWREALLAQAVLENKTVGYKNHPQLERFKHSDSITSLATIGRYLLLLHKEASLRHYNFNVGLINSYTFIPHKHLSPYVTEGQLNFEWSHFLNKIVQRDKVWYTKVVNIKPEINPCFSTHSSLLKNSWEKAI